MNKDRAAERLQETIMVPDIVQQRADQVFAQIRKEGSTGKGGGKQMGYTGKTVKRGMWAAVAAAVMTFGAVACAAYMHWSRGMEEQLNVTPEQKVYLEENQVTAPVNKSVTQEGITVTVQQTIVDARFAYLSFRVDGYQVEEGMEPCFDYVDTTVDGNFVNVIGGTFFDNLHVDADGKFTYTDGTPARERADGSIVGKYVNEDGSMEYIMTLMRADEDDSLIGKPIHIELQNLGTVSKAAYTPDITATWAFDFTLEASEQIRSVELSQPLGDSGATVTKAELSPISLYVEYGFPLQETGLEGIDQDGNTINTTTYVEPPHLTGVRLKDGTRLTCILNGGAEGYRSEDTDTYVVYYAINHVIDPEEVDALLFVKESPQTQQEAYNMPEEKLYIVSF